MSIPRSLNEKPMESLAEIFRCFICMEKLQDAHMCPHCSKLCCFSCINRWLSDTRSQCPHCRAFLDIQDVVNCRWAEEVTQQLDYLEENLPGKKRSLNLSNLESTDNIEKCSTHQREELSVYCGSCNCCICHECALWSSTHTGHIFKPVDDVYNFHCQQVKEQVNRLQNKYKELRSSIKDIQKNMDFIRAAKDQRVRDIRNTVELMIARLDSNLEAKMVTLVRMKNHLVRKSEDIDALLGEINIQLNSGRKSELILKQSSKFIKSIQELIDKSSFTVTPVSPDFHSELVPNYDSSYFIVNNFSQARGKADAFYSEPMLVNGLSWRLKVYPDGNGIVRGSYLSVFLELNSGPSESAKYEYRIEMIYQVSNDSERNLMREFASDYEVGECWGYNRFFRLDLLESEGYLDTVNDCLKLKFEVRPTSYYQKCKDQQWYISYLLNSGVQQSAKIQELKDRLQLLEEDAVPVSAIDESHPAFDALTHDEKEKNARTEELFAAYESRRRVRSPHFRVESSFGEIELEVGNESDNNSDNASDTNSVKHPTPSEENDVDEQEAALALVRNTPQQSLGFISDLALINMGFTENDDTNNITETDASSPNYVNLVDELQFLFLTEPIPLYSVEVDQINETTPSSNNTISETNNDPDSELLEANGSSIPIINCNVSE